MALVLDDLLEWLDARNIVIRAFAYYIVGPVILIGYFAAMIIWTLDQPWVALTILPVVGIIYLIREHRDNRQREREIKERATSSSP